MSSKNFSTYILVDKSPREAFQAINNVRDWWTENVKGNSQKLNDEFTVQFGDVHKSQTAISILSKTKKNGLALRSASKSLQRITKHRCASRTKG
jgi:hypothetical protein